MKHQHESRVPGLLRWLVLFASWIVPGRERSAWRARQQRQLKQWWVLVELGELTTYSSREIARNLRRTCGDFFWARIGRENVRRLVRGPALFVWTAGALFTMLASASHGFEATRKIASVFHVMLFPPANLPQDAIPFHGGDTVVVFSVPIVCALIIAILFVAFRHFNLRPCGRRYWAFLATKLTVVMTLIPLGWIELSALVRTQMPHTEFRALVTGLIFRLIFMGAFVYAFGWCFRDQERRCPICLQWLANPVSIGNLSNVFEPAITEFLCEQGHGVLSVPEVAGVEPDRWTAFDPSWSELFEAPGR